MERKATVELALELSVGLDHTGNDVTANLFDNDETALATRYAAQRRLSEQVERQSWEQHSVEESEEFEDYDDDVVPDEAWELDFQDDDAHTPPAISAPEIAPLVWPHPQIADLAKLVPLPEELVRRESNGISRAIALHPEILTYHAPIVPYHGDDPAIDAIAATESLTDAVYDDNGDLVDGAQIDTTRLIEAEPGLTVVPLLSEEVEQEPEPAPMPEPEPEPEPAVDDDDWWGPIPSNDGGGGGGLTI